LSTWCFGQVFLAILDLQPGRMKNGRPYLLKIRPAG
jgi:hypothetical protein